MRLLNERGVEYLVIGGYAVGFHGFPRPTGDLDVWVSVHPRNTGKLVGVLREFGFGEGTSAPDLFTIPGRIIRLGIPPVRIELQTVISGVAFDECFQQRVLAELDGIPANLISLDHLKRNKQAVGRHKDLTDLENLP